MLLIDILAQAEATCDTATHQQIFDLLDTITGTLSPYYPVAWAIIITRKILM